MFKILVPFSLVACFSPSLFAAITLSCDIKFYPRMGNQMDCGTATLVWDLDSDEDKSLQEGVGPCKELTLQIGNYGEAKTRNNYFLIVGLQPKEGPREATQLSFFDHFPGEFDMSPYFTTGTAKYNCKVL